MQAHAISYSIRVPSFVLCSLAGVLFYANCTAQESRSEPELETVTVTGTRIPQTASEGPSPVYVLSRKQLEAEGFTTVEEALRTFSQVTGVSQNDQYAGGFTQNASAINMRGLGPGRTLILLDGRRIADYPLPYNGESNFVNVAALPTAAIDRIEVLSGGASAIYGSDAVAGVVNVILRKDIATPLDISVRGGSTSQGGGKSTRLQAVGGFQEDAFELTYAAEFMDRDPIYAFQRKFMDSVDDNPNPAGRIAARAILRGDPFDNNGDGYDYIDPGAAACAKFPGFEYSFRPGRGYYCGQRDADAQQTIRNGRKQGSLYTNASWNLGGAELFGSINYFHSHSEYDDGFHYWYPVGGSYVYNESNSQFEDLQRFFLPFEQGGRDAELNKYNETTWDFNGGARGALINSWKYEASVSTSRYTVDGRARRLLLNETENYFLGQQTGTDPYIHYYPAYADVNIARLYTPLTPAVYNSISAIDEDRAHSSTSSASVVVTGDLLRLPAGPLSMAGILEWGTQKYRIDLDPRLIAGEFWNLAGSGGGGKRDRYATGAELSVPIVASLRASLAGRYDKYNDITQLNDAFTYKAGLEYRPVRPVLLRGSLATSFRAPDMHYVFADPSGFFQTVTDDYLCRRDEPNTALPACSKSDVNIQGARQGNPNLKEETGKSFTLGMVLEPLEQLKFTVDYYHIDLSGLVVDNPVDRILQLEADCRLGHTVSGAPVDIHSAECQDALSRVRRAPVSNTAASEQLLFITTGPINTANYYTSGFDATLRYALPPLPFGEFVFETAYSHVLKYDIQNFAGDPIKNHRDDPQSFDLRSHIRASLNWKYRQLESTLFMERIGSIPNWAQTGRIPPQAYFNLTANYAFPDEHTSIGIAIDNLLNRNPPRDPTYDVYPYFSEFNYSAVGREWFVEARYKF